MDTYLLNGTIKPSLRKTTGLLFHLREALKLTVTVLRRTLNEMLEKCGTSPGRTTDLGSGVSGLNV